MKRTLSKTVEVESTSDITLLAQAFEPIAHAFCLNLQSNGMIGRTLKIGVKDDGKWQGAEFDFIVWRYDDLIKQIGGNLAVVIDWTAANAIHLSVSDIVAKEEIPALGNPDLVIGQ